jgi:hypothetical protein
MVWFEMEEALVRITAESEMHDRSLARYQRKQTMMAPYWRSHQEEAVPRQTSCQRLQFWIYRSWVVLFISRNIIEF